MGYCPSLSSVLSSKKGPRSLIERVEKFLYRATCVLTGLRAMRDAEKHSVMCARAYIKQIRFPKNRRIAISVDPLFYAYAQLPSLLTSLVVMQNQLLPLAKGILDLPPGSVPSSLNSAMKGEMDRYGLPDSVREGISSYWKQSGKYIRDVRDVNEHFDTLIDHTFLDCSSDPGQILIFLPDNPEIKSPKEFTFSWEKDAFATIEEDFRRSGYS